MSGSGWFVACDSHALAVAERLRAFAEPLGDGARAFFFLGDGDDDDDRAALCANLIYIIMRALPLPRVMHGDLSDLDAAAEAVARALFQELTIQYHRAHKNKKKTKSSKKGRGSA